MNNEDEIKVRGVVYLAVDGKYCTACHLKDLCGHVDAPCSPEYRKDGRSIIFVEKQ